MPSGTTITAISGTSVTLSNVASATVAAGAIRFSPILDAQTLGATGGELSHVNTVAETAAHTHANTVGETAHSHSSAGIGTGTSGELTGSGGSYYAIVTDGAAKHNTDTATAGVTITNVSAGGGLGHNNQPKTIVMNYIIKR